MDRDGKDRSEMATDIDAVVALLDGRVSAGDSRIKLTVAEGQSAEDIGSVSRQGGAMWAVPGQKGLPLMCWSDCHQLSTFSRWIEVIFAVFVFFCIMDHPPSNNTIVPSYF